MADTGCLGRKALVYDLGTIKLADFGLSKTLPVNKHAGFDLDSRFKLTGETGSYRFMAREVFVHEAYNNKARAAMPCTDTYLSKYMLRSSTHIPLLAPLLAEYLWCRSNCCTSNV